MLIARICLAFVCITLNGCAVSYYDTKTQTQNIWGFGHLAVKQTQSGDGTVATITEETSLGAAIRIKPEFMALNLGYSSDRLMNIESQSASISLTGPSANLFDLNVGKLPPWYKTPNSAKISTAK